MIRACCPRHRCGLRAGDCGPLSRADLAAITEAARDDRSDATARGYGEIAAIAETVIALAEQLVERLPVELPSHRSSSIRSARLGSTSIDVSVSRLDTRIVELFVDIAHREGAPLVGIGHAIARLASLALQHGTPIEAVIRALAGTTGGAAEVTEADGIERAESIPDLVAQLLELEVRR